MPSVAGSFRQTNETCIECPCPGHMYLPIVMIDAQSLPFAWHYPAPMSGVDYRNSFGSLCIPYPIRRRRYMPRLFHPSVQSPHAVIFVHTPTGVAPGKMRSRIDSGGRSHRSPISKTRFLPSTVEPICFACLPRKALRRNSEFQRFERHLGRSKHSFEIAKNGVTNSRQFHC